MKTAKNLVADLLVLSFVLIGAGCTPKNVAGRGTETHKQQVSGFRLTEDEAVGLVQVTRKIAVETKIAEGDSDAVVYAKGLAAAPAGAFVRCNGIGGLAAADVFSELDLIAAIGNVSVDANGKLLRQDPVDGRTDAVIGCSVVGKMVWPAPVIASLFEDVFADPTKASERDFTATQTAYLSMRGAYTKGDVVVRGFFFDSFMKQLSAHKGRRSMALDVAALDYLRLDADLNPCSPLRPRFRWGPQIDRGRNFRCVAATHVKRTFRYLPIAAPALAQTVDEALTERFEALVSGSTDDLALPLLKLMHRAEPWAGIVDQNERKLAAFLLGDANGTTWSGIVSSATIGLALAGSASQADQGLALGPVCCRPKMMPRYPPRPHASSLGAFPSGGFHKPILLKPSTPAKPGITSDDIRLKRNMDTLANGMPRPAFSDYLDAISNHPGQIEKEIAVRPGETGTEFMQRAEQIEAAADRNALSEMSKAISAGKGVNGSSNLVYDGKDASGMATFHSKDGQEVIRADQTGRFSAWAKNDDGTWDMDRGVHNVDYVNKDGGKSHVGLELKGDPRTGGELTAHVPKGGLTGSADAQDQQFKFKMNADGSINCDRATMSQFRDAANERLAELREADRNGDQTAKDQMRKINQEYDTVRKAMKCSTGRSLSLLDESCADELDSKDDGGGSEDGAASDAEGPGDGSASDTEAAGDGSASDTEAAGDGSASDTEAIGEGASDTDASGDGAVSDTASDEGSAAPMASSDETQSANDGASATQEPETGKRELEPAVDQSPEPDQPSRPEPQASEPEPNPIQKPNDAQE